MATYDRSEFKLGRKNENKIKIKIEEFYSFCIKSSNWWVNSFVKIKLKMKVKIIVWSNHEEKKNDECKSIKVKYWLEKLNFVQATIKMIVEMWIKNVKAKIKIYFFWHRNAFKLFGSLVHWNIDNLKLKGNEIRKYNTMNMNTDKRNW